MKDSRVPDKMESVGPECFEQYIPTDTLTYVTWHGIRMTVRHMIGFAEVIDLVNCIVEVCSPQQGAVPKPELFEAAFRACVLTWYANVKLPDDIEKQYALTIGSSLYKAVCGAINEEQLESVREAAKKYFE